MGLLAEYICYQWYSITILTMLALILFFLMAVLMVLMVALHYKVLKMPWLCLLQQVCDVKVCINNCTCSDIPDNINSNTGIGLPILGWTNMKYVV